MAIRNRDLIINKNPKSLFSESIRSIRTNIAFASLDKDVKIIVDKNTRDIKYNTEIKINNNLKAPLNKGTVIGKMILNYDNKEYIYNLVLTDDVKKASYFKIFKNHLKDLITGNVRK